jgi:hypothetical protein
MLIVLNENSRLWEEVLFSIVVMFGVGLAAAISGFSLRNVAGLAIELIIGLVASIVNVRYLVFLLLTRRWSGHWLPFRMGQFLEWCCEVGLMRRAGVAYQFRHRELQDYLARTAAASPSVP